MFVYPASLLRKVAWRLPLVLWRTGLAPAFSILPMVVITTRRRKTGQPRTVTTDYTSFDGRSTSCRVGASGTSGIGTSSRSSGHDSKARTCPAATAHRVIDPVELADVFQHVQHANPMWKRFLRSWDIEDNVDDFCGGCGRCWYWACSLYAGERVPVIERKG